MAGTRTKERRRKEGTLNLTATQKFVRASAFKLRRLASMVKGKNFEEAVAILRFSGSSNAQKLNMVLISAGANAEYNGNHPKSSLFVKNIEIGRGPIIKWFRPRARGRVFPIRKPMSHIYVEFGVVENG
jgi:large subunit ribosomal protein L22